MSTAVDQTVDWIVGLQKLIGDQLFGVGNRLASWLLLGNAGALVILFNQKLGSDFIPIDDVGAWRLLSALACSAHSLEL